ncbi:hypothetical protein Taro_052036 [Colocasia esculenta]|uniref:Uncharacterized protein n=1 Tax=Colocasia esculenta TaxID=4460 RepID=A0A843XII6_COLES|nr:hypothetical protein [Colocasia esculenta]
MFYLSRLLRIYEEVMLLCIGLKRLTLDEGWLWRKRCFQDDRSSKKLTSALALRYLDMQHVVDGILISTEIEKEVMSRKMGTEYCEVSMTHAQRPNTSLFVKDQFRKRLSDALGSHILWLKDYVMVHP